MPGSAATGSVHALVMPTMPRAGSSEAGVGITNPRVGIATVTAMAFPIAGIARSTATGTVTATAFPITAIAPPTAAAPPTVPAPAPVTVPDPVTLSTSTAGSLGKPAISILPRSLPGRIDRGCPKSDQRNPDRYGCRG